MMLFPCGYYLLGLLIGCTYFFNFSFQYSYDLLLQYLHKSQSIIMLGIINEHINFQGAVRSYLFFISMLPLPYLLLTFPPFAYVIYSFSWTTNLNC